MAIDIEVQAPPVPSVSVPGRRLKVVATLLAGWQRLITSIDQQLLLYIESALAQFTIRHMQLIHLTTARRAD